MATSAVAREMLSALRHQIAKMEGRLAESLDASAPSEGSNTIVRRHGIPVTPSWQTGSTRLDALFDATTGLMEVHGAATRDSGAASGFALALASIITRKTSLPLLWIGSSDMFREAGRPYPPGLAGRFGVAPDRLLVAQAEKTADLLWIAEQAASLNTLAAVLLEMRGTSSLLDLTATRRLHSRALAAGHSLFLVRHAGIAEPTAAPLRLVVSPAPAGVRHTFFGPLEGSIGPPAFTISVGKSRTSAPAVFTLQWNSEAHAFEERDHDSGVVAAPYPGALAALPADGTDFSQPLRTVMAFTTAGGATDTGGQPPREQHPAHRVA